MNPVISSLERLTSPPADLPWPDFDYAIVESAAAIEFLDLTQPEQAPIAAQFPSGVAFGLNSELRWLTREGGMHFVYISDEGLALTDAQPTPLVLAPAEAPERLYLWGMKNKDDDDFFESRIPRRLRYNCPERLSHGERVTIRLRHYLLPVEVGQAGPPVHSDVPIFRLVRLESGEAAHE
jgi:hypothetical protein